MMRSLYSGVAGLKTHQTKMDVIGNNIANVNTTSFKSQSITFSDLMYQTTQNASGATLTKGGVNARQIGLGAKSGAINTAIESQGATQTTNNPFDLMITGKAFFVVNNGKENLYTRDGSFYIDGAGNLAMQSNGYFVMGWNAVEDPETGEISVNKNGELSNLQIMSADNSTYSPASTTQGLFSGNIDDNDKNITSDEGKTITLEFYDNKGYLYTGKFRLKDTGTDHLFSIQLTDILDSTGNTINKKLSDGSMVMDHITMGTVQNKDKSIEDTHEIIVSATGAEIYQKAGSDVYKDVPRTGVLADVMASSKTSNSGLLNKLYGIPDAEVLSKEHGYYKTSSYVIDDSGTMKITYEKDHIKNQSLITGYSYKTSNTSETFYVANDGSGKAYSVPSGTGGYMKDLFAKEKATLVNVFGMDETTELDKYMNDSSYSYTFTSKNGATADQFVVTKSSTLATTQSAGTYSEQKSFSTWNDDFVDGEGNLTLDSTVEAYKTAHPEETIFYSYASGKIKVIGSKLDESGSVTPVATEQFSGTITNFSQNTITKISNLSPAQKVELATVLNEVYGENSVIGGTETETVSLVTNYLNNKGYSDLKFVALTGTVGLTFYKSTPGYVADDTKTIFTGTNFSKTYEAEEGTEATKYTVKTPNTFFRNTADGYAYVLSDNETKLGDYNKDILKEVYDIDTTDSTKGYTANSQVSFSSTGAITIFDEEEESLKLSSDYSTSEGSSDSTISYITNNPTIAYSKVPLEGDLSTLLETSSGENAYQGLLKNVYGLSDEDADAYGSDGTYKINTDGSITLYTGTQTIQLAFDAATGKIVSANGNPNALVNIVFDQEQDGLEAMGYQKSPSDGDDAIPGRMTLDFSTVTNYNTNGSATIKAVKGDKKSLNTGRAVGEMNGVTVSTDGQIYATYSNGQTKLLGQIASAEFANASGLMKEGDNLYKSTLNSGEATIQDITTDGGYMNTGVLEMSNVDLSSQFTEMITTQRGFQANSRIITVSDTLLEELTNLKR